MSTGSERWAVRWRDADGDTGTQHFDDRADADHLYAWMCDDPGIVEATLWEQTLIETCSS